ncbi:hypothetical protein Peur_050411 [Populus x canadensis]
MQEHLALILDEWSGLDKKAGGSSGFLMALLIQVRPLSIIEPAATFTSRSKYRDMFFLGGVDTKIFLPTDLLTSSSQKKAGRHTASYW